MEHAEALERIEIAAAEPEGLERLMAGDTADAASIAGHLAGCPGCTAELARIRRTATVAREVIRTAPDPALRARTLAYVKAAGVPRGLRADGAAAPPAVDELRPAAEAASGAARPASSSVTPVSIDAERPGRTAARLRLAVTALAATLVIAIGTGAALYRNAAAEADAALQEKDAQIAVLEETSLTSVRVSAQPDARQIELAAAAGAGDATGTLLFSPSGGELVAVATNLEPEREDQEYGCWVEVDGTRTRLGRMYWAGDLWAWAGPVAGLGDIPPGATFGVSLGPVGGGGDAAPVLTGEL